MRYTCTMIQHTIRITINVTSTPLAPFGRNRHPPPPPSPDIPTKNEQNQGCNACERQRPAPATGTRFCLEREIQTLHRLRSWNQRMRVSPRDHRPTTPNPTTTAKSYNNASQQKHTTNMPPQSMRAKTPPTNAWSWPSLSVCPPVCLSLSLSLSLERNPRSTSREINT